MDSSVNHHLIVVEEFAYPNEPGSYAVQGGLPLGSRVPGSEGYRGPDPEPGLGLGLDGERLVVSSTSMGPAGPSLSYLRGYSCLQWTHHPQDKHEGSGAVWIGREAGLSLRDRVRSSDIREELGVEPLLLHIERKVFWTCPTGRRPRGRPRTKWRDYISHLASERLGVPPEELMEVAGERAVWAPS
ncbi:hypothetical protein D4764_15G0005620 [Takifugu flavidus]|uniref:Uncharacterized protein n=1 Tax=Takifugu flavidus TaxID=433684 RepID=A0A5C6P1Z8_9TELE|nr:hypothetical protein D4764_15G0005620 [Takifugu flavidus]